jgi:hypothetical protein
MTMVFSIFDIMSSDITTLPKMRVNLESLAEVIFPKLSDTRPGLVAAFLDALQISLTSLSTLQSDTSCNDASRRAILSASCMHELMLCLLLSLPFYKLHTVRAAWSRPSRGDVPIRFTICRWLIRKLFSPLSMQGWCSSILNDNV